MKIENFILIISEDIIHLLEYNSENLEKNSLIQEYSKRDVKLMKELQENINNVSYIKNFHDNIRNFSQSFGSYSSNGNLIDKKLEVLYQALEDYIILIRTNKL